MRRHVLRPFVFLVSAFILIALNTSQGNAEPTEISLELNPRLDAWAGSSTSHPDFNQEFKQELYLRTAIDAVKQFNLTSLRARIDGFATMDRAEVGKKPFGAPDLRKSRDEADLNEAWFDINQDSFGVRIGRQPIRWSQSWTLPSLDILSGRRFNRLFLDPLVDQLTHPDAIRLTKTGVVDLDLVRVFKSAPIRFASPVPNREREDFHETAIKASTKLGLLDFAFIGSHKLEPRVGKDEIQTGLLASYAFEDVVLKAEMANSDRDALFFTFGTDWFLDEWLVGPQFTVFRDAFIQAPTGDGLVYLPIRYSKEKWAFELDLLKGVGSSSSAEDFYSSLRIGYEFASGFSASIATQIYRGESGRFLGQAESLTGGRILGLRLDYIGGFNL